MKRFLLIGLILLLNSIQMAQADNQYNIETENDFQYNLKARNPMNDDDIFNFDSEKVITPYKRIDDKYSIESYSIEESSAKSNSAIENSRKNNNSVNNRFNESYTNEIQDIVYRRTIKIPAGTAVTVYTENEIDADDVRRGQNVDFIVQEPVSVNGITVIKPGTHVTAQVTKKKNNFIFGVPGEIEVSNFKIVNSESAVINMRGVIVDKGTNRTWCNVGWFFVWPLLFIKGNDGKIPAGTYQIVYTAGDTNVNLNIPANNF